MISEPTRADQTFHSLSDHAVHTYAQLAGQHLLLQVIFEGGRKRYSQLQIQIGLLGALSLQNIGLPIPFF